MLTLSQVISAKSFILVRFCAILSETGNMSNAQEKRKSYVDLQLGVQVADLILGATCCNQEGLPCLCDKEDPFITELKAETQPLRECRDMLEKYFQSVAVGLVGIDEALAKCEGALNTVEGFSDRFWSVLEKKEFGLTMGGYGRKRDCDLTGFAGAYADNIYGHRVAQYLRIRVASEIVRETERPNPFTQQVDFFAIGDQKSFSFIEGHIRDGVIRGIERTNFLPVQGPWYLTVRQSRMLRAYVEQKRLAISSEVGSHLCSWWGHFGRLGLAGVERAWYAGQERAMGVKSGLCGAWWSVRRNIRKRFGLRGLIILP
jgi:hypothetical protein